MTKELNRRLFLSAGATASAAALAARMGFGLSESGPAREGQPAREKVWTLALEEYAKRGCNYCNRMVDKNGLPYFDAFWTDPAEAAHDWPDFGDVMSRQFQAVIMARHMTPVWRQRILSLIDTETGLLTRPETSYSKKVADDGDQLGPVQFARRTPKRHTDRITSSFLKLSATHQLGGFPHLSASFKVWASLTPAFSS
jgi:hypothetical protein